MSDLANTKTVDTDRFPEWEPFAEAVEQRRPESGTWCEAWTVRDIVIHQTGNAEELARVLGGHLAGDPVSTRGFEEREVPFRVMRNADLWSAFIDRMNRLSEVAAAAEELPDDTDVAWTGRTMKVPWFAEHMREELPAEADTTSIGLSEPDGPATLECDAASRVLLLWGRRPADPGRISSSVGPEKLGRLRTLLSGY